MIAYIFKSSLSLIILFGLYWFLLRKEKLFIFNRYFLILSVVFSLIVPFITIPVNLQTIPQLEEINLTNDHITTEIRISENFVSLTSAEVQPSGIDISAILMVLYLSGVLIFLIRFLRNIYLIFTLVKESEKISFERYRIVLTNDTATPYCFFNSIFMNRDDYLKGRISKDLLNHEMEHLRQLHTIDIILIELVKIFYWFNPVHLLYDRAIRINHEYLADHGVIRDSFDIKSYIENLLGFITGRNNIPITTGSNNSFMKKRLLMMTKSGSGSIIYGIRIALTLGLVMVFFLSMSFKESDDPISSINKYEKQGENGVIEIPESGKTMENIENKSDVTNIPKEQKTEKTARSVNMDTYQDAVVASARMNVLYRGIANLVEIAVPGITSDKVTATITNGTIKGVANGWEVITGDQNESVITVLVNNKKVSEKKFRVKNIPNPVAVFYGITNGAISRNLASKTEVLEAELKDFDLDLKFEIVSFNFLMRTDTANVEISANGNKLTDKMKSLISEFKRGQEIIFKDIKAAGPDGKIRDLNPIILTIE